MSEKDYAPLSAACVRALNDKIYDKRKSAATEIEKMVKDFAVVNNTVQIKKLLKVLRTEFATSQNPHSRKGGLIGLASAALALGRDSAQYLDDLVLPVLACLSDMDSRVRYHACESLYNVLKVVRGSLLVLFNDIFDALSRLAADPDQNVRSGCEQLDRLLKDVVTESSQFDLVSFIPLLRERMYAHNRFARQFVISWVKELDSVPDIDMLVFLPEILDGLFSILGDSAAEIKTMCEQVVGEFLESIKKSPAKVNCPAMTNVLIVHAQSADQLIQYTAIVWIKEFVTLAGSSMLPFTSGILSAILPCLAYDDDGRKNIREAAKAVNHSLKQLVKLEGDLDQSSSCTSLKAGDSDLSHEEKQSREEVCSSVELDLTAVVDVLTRHLMVNSMQTKEAVLRWIYHLLINIPYKMFRHVEEMFHPLLKTLSDSTDEVALLDLEVLAEICSSPAGLRHRCRLDQQVPAAVRDLLPQLPNMNSYFLLFTVSLLQMFSTDRRLLDDRGSFIIRQLCLLLNAEDIYRTLALTLLHEEDLSFAGHMVQTLNMILLTSTELFHLRSQLKELKTQESCALFTCLYQSWCHNPVATLSLCLLTQNYQQACQLILAFENLEVTVELLTEIDKLVQLIESPIFSYLRLQLLEPRQNQLLVKSLYGLLMLLPQSEAFSLLQRRLQCIPSVHLIPADQQLKTRPHECTNHIDFDQLLEHFFKVQEHHKQARRIKRSSERLCKSMGAVKL